MKDLPKTCRHPDSKQNDAIIPFVIRKIPLGDASQYVKTGGHPNTYIVFSPDSRLLAIGTMQGNVMIADVYSGKILWSKKVSEGMVKRIDFSPDGKRVYFGEQSVDGFIYAAETVTGKILWTFRLADDLQQGSPLNKNDAQDIYDKPGCYQLKTLANGDILILGIHSWGDWREKAKTVCLSRIYRLTPDGKPVWAFPEKGPIFYTVIYMDSDPAGKKVAFLTRSEGGNKPENYEYFNQSLYVLDGITGKVDGYHTFEPLKPWFSKVSFWQSVSVSDDAACASIGTQDGRSFIFELKKVTPLKTFDFGAPVMISNVPVSAYASYTKYGPDKTIYFQTSNTSVIAANMSRSIVAPPGPHPNANMINAVSPAGEILWRYRSNLSCENFWLSADGRWMMTTAMAGKGKAEHEAGALLFDTQRSGGGSSKFVYFYRVEGTVFFQAAMAPDGSAFAISEMPFKHPESSKLIGTYQVHVVR
ncbi:MAG: WD40 repeat domain-containing protein [Fibrobacter sp.]|nr:WD40 repeat domain-containing protein [Fibrobacter sp.]